MGTISNIKIVETEKAPKPIGPFSQAIVAGDYVFTSGCIAQDPKTGKLAEGGIKEQTEQVFDNLEAIMKGASIGLGHVVKATVYLKDLADFREMNKVYERRFDGHKPARSTVQADLALNARVEIEFVAYTKAITHYFGGGPV